MILFGSNYGVWVEHPVRDRMLVSFAAINDDSSAEIRKRGEVVNENRRPACEECASYPTVLKLLKSYRKGAVRPPSTIIECPIKYAAASEQNQTIASAASRICRERSSACTLRR